MPPCRSSPRLIRSRGGYTYHSEASTTIATSAIRTQCCLRILLRASRHHDAPDRGPVELEPDLVADPERDRGIGQAGDRAVQPAAGDDAVAALERPEQLLALTPLLLLGADEQEVEDREDGGEEEKLGDQRPRA